MFDPNEIKSALSESMSKLDTLRRFLCIETKRDRLKEINKAMMECSYNRDLVIEYSATQKLIESFDQLYHESVDAGTLWQLAIEASDEDTMQEAGAILYDLLPRIGEFEFQQMFTGDDRNNAIISINSGAGGREAQDWARMLFRMYQGWAGRHGFDIKPISILKTDEDGIKNVDFLISGECAYGMLKVETGVHRLVRNSPFDSKNSRHTSFCSVFVSPEIDDKIEIEIKESDLKIDRFCSSGPGGQNVNKLETAIRITHLPSKIVVSCQDNRYQHSNEETARRLLRSKLYELELQKKRDKMQEAHDGMSDISWGHQIRSYFLQPKVIITDHRTGEERYDANKILSGDIDSFIRAALLKK